jgi:hypothetical protein
MENRRSLGVDAKNLADYLANCMLSETEAHQTPKQVDLAVEALRSHIRTFDFQLELAAPDGSVHVLASADQLETIRSAYTATRALFPDREIQLRCGDEILSTIDLALL